MERNYSPFGNKKVDLIAPLYHLAKTKQQKEKPGTVKLYKSRDVPAKKTLKNNSRHSDKINEKLAIYQYLNHKIPKKSEESKIFHPSIHYTPSRHGSKSQLQDEKDFSLERKLLEASILQQRQLFEAMEGAHKSKIKSSSYFQNQNNLAILLKSAQKPSQSNIGKGHYASPPMMNIMSLNRGFDDRKKANEPKVGDFAKELKKSMNFQDISQPREKSYIPQNDIEIPSKKHHRRGLSSGQNPIYMEQQLAMERLALEQERQERIRQQQLQQQLLKQQQQMQMQQYKMMKDPQQEEDEYYEEFFHMDKMTFDFERLIIAQKLSQSQLCTPSATPSNKKSYSHSRTKSIEEPNSLLPTKSTSRWTTKRSSIGDDYHHGGNGNGGRDHFNLIEQISDLDKTDEREEIRRYYKM